MSFTGSEDHSISLAEAARMTKEFRDNNPGKVLGAFYGKDAINAILNQPGCVGIRYYNAISSENKNVIVLVGVDANENDLYNGVLAEYGLKCPSYCSINNPLNS